MVVGERTFFQGSAHRLILKIAPLALLRLSRHDPTVGALVVSRLEAARRLTPRGHWMAATRGLSLTAAVGVIDRVHRHATIVRHPSQPPAAAGLAERYV